MTRGKSNSQSDGADSLKYKPPPGILELARLLGRMAARKDHEREIIERTRKIKRNNRKKRKTLAVTDTPVRTCYSSKMNDTNTVVPVHSFASGEFEFGEWRTPFSDSDVTILEVAYAPKRPDPDDKPRYYRDQSLLRTPGDDDLVARVYNSDTDCIFRAVFSETIAFRLLDEHGLTQLWSKTEELGGRPAKSTFRVRNHLWTAESRISFIHGTDDGWSFVIASDLECLEVLSVRPPLITKEHTRK